MRSFLAALSLCLFAATISNAHAEVGIASTYADNDGHQFTRAACGGRVDPRKLTAAHRSLPCGSNVEVTNKRNGRRVTVKITDRGPFKKGRIIDLTPAAAHAIGSNGLALVDVHRVTASTGAKASVSTVARSHFQCLIGKLESAGYRIDFMGGYASRGNSSAHPTGNALDINQTARNRVTRRLPSNATDMAHECGLEHGEVWSRPDTGHFEMARKYGYVYNRRVRMARLR